MAAHNARQTGGHQQQHHHPVKLPLCTAAPWEACPALQRTLLLAKGHKGRLLKRLEQGAHHNGPQPRHQLHRGTQGDEEPACECWGEWAVAGRSCNATLLHGMQARHAGTASASALQAPGPQGTPTAGRQPSVHGTSPRTRPGRGCPGTQPPPSCCPRPAPASQRPVAGRGGAEGWQGAGAL